MRKNGVLSQTLLAAAFCLQRRSLRVGFYSDIRAHSLMSFHQSCEADVISLMNSTFNALRENLSMSQEDINQSQPSRQLSLAGRKWAAAMLKPKDGVEVEMDLPDVGQG
eukprot:s93_g8.t1